MLNFYLIKTGNKNQKKKKENQRKNCRCDHPYYAFIIIIS